ncbi:hypothetical protein [Ureibacillus sinduriensis]|uniref:Uncharacterized protein n=1 Tax=Ureibacillus sinduriensis BLB-1 = JCM 15800 TaxID=1384057 RepID=A0A0A3IJ33_9BACL|nr:hypothetical protein [Ureibacillus sinduriensis]KGR74872.1 hypothetical protein CD33_13990 [Ureibacillus sinduriensis BLB-1 = JCM 15800]
MSGWISLHRKLMDNPIYSNAGMLKLWVHCLLKASHAEHEQLVGNQVIKLQPGQFVTGRNALATEFNKGAKKEDIVSPITLWRWLNLFEKLEMLNIKKTTKYSVVTVINWGGYQHHEQQVNNKRTTNEQQMNTNNNVNNVNNDNNISSRKQKRVYEEDSDEMKLTNFFIQEVQKNDSLFTCKNKQSWCEDFRKIIEIDKRDKSEISKLIRWIQQDDFWKSNVLSPSKLRKQYSNLLIKMNATKPVVTQEPKSPSYVNNVSEKDLLNMGE